MARAVAPTLCPDGPQATPAITARQTNAPPVADKILLPGRGRLFAHLCIPLHGNVLAIGRRTDRNTEHLSRLRPDLRLHSLHVTPEHPLLAPRIAGTAATPASSACAAQHPGVGGRQAGAPALFDAVVFCYALSRTPDWREALTEGLRAVKTGGAVAVVDYWGQGGLPGWFSWLHERWLDANGVRLVPEVLTHLRHLEREKSIQLDVDTARSGFAFLAWAVKNASCP